MRKLDILIIILVITIVGFLFYDMWKAPPSPIVEDSVVVIIDSFTGRLGSGVIIDFDGLILTAKHVINGMISPVIVFSDGAMCSVVEDTYISPDQDVALLRIKSDHVLYPLKFGNPRTLYPGDPLKIIGAPFGNILWHAYGSVARPTHEGIIEMDIHGNPGHSGCPILDTNDDIVGIAIGGYPGTGMTFGVSSDLIQVIIEKYEVLRYGGQEENGETTIDGIFRETRSIRPYN